MARPLVARNHVSYKVEEPMAIVLVSEEGASRNRSGSDVVRGAG